VTFLVEAYEKANGDVPLIGFLSELNPKMRAKVLRDIDLLEKEGNLLREPYTKYLGNGIYELRTKQSSDIARTLFFFFTGNRIIITHGFTKKSDKTPSKEINKALRYKEDWIRRNVDEI